MGATQLGLYFSDSSCSDLVKRTSLCLCRSYVPVGYTHVHVGLHVARATSAMWAIWYTSFRMFKITAQQAAATGALKQDRPSPGVPTAFVVQSHWPLFSTPPPPDQLRALTFCPGDPQQQLRTVKQLFHQAVQLSRTGRCWLTPAHSPLG